VKHAELNLVAIFDTIMTEGSMTKAADRLALTQSAVSNAVSRMRLIWKDPLFIRDGRGIKPSAKAQAMWLEIQGPLAAIRASTAPASFDPSTSTQKFRLALTDYLSNALWPALRQHIEAYAPGVSLYAVPYTSQGTHRQLAENEIDMSFGALQYMGPEIHMSDVFSEGWVCAMRPDHPLSRGTLALDDFLAADHLLVSLSGNPVGAIDGELERLGMRRKVAMTLNNFAGVPSLLMSSNLISVLPAGVIQTHALKAEVHTTALPLDVPPFLCKVAWHARNDRDAGHRWMRALVLKICEEIWNNPS